MKGKNPNKINQDYCNPGKRKFIEKISLPRLTKGTDNFNVLHMFV